MISKDALSAKSSIYKLKNIVVNWDANSKFLIFTNNSKEIEIYSSESFQKLFSYIFCMRVEHIEFHPNYSDIFVATLSKTEVYIFYIDIINKVLTTKVKYNCANNNALLKTIFSSYDDGKYLATVTNSDIKIWNIDEYYNIYNINMESNLNILLNFPIKWSQYGKYLIYPQSREKIEVFSLEKKLVEFHLNKKAKSGYFLEKSNEIIILNGKNISIWNPKKNINSLSINHKTNIAYSCFDYEKSHLYIYDNESLTIYDLKAKNEIFYHKMDEYENFSLLKNAAQNLNLFSKIIFFSPDYTFELLEIISKYNVTPNLNKEENVPDIFWDNVISEIKNNYDYLSFANNVLENKEIIKKKYLSIQKIIDEFDNFLENKTLEERRFMVLNDIKNLNEYETVDIDNMYLNFIKNIIKDNTNKNLLEKYLFFLKKNETALSNIYLDSFESFNDEIKQFQACFTKDELTKKINYHSKIHSEKEKFLDFLNEFIKNNTFTDVSNFVDVKKNELQNFVFNQPISFENNDELYYCRCRIVLIYNLEKIVAKNEQNIWTKMNYCIKKVLKRKIFDNIKIAKNKNDITSILILMAVPQSKIITKYNLNLIYNENVDVTKNELLNLGFQYDNSKKYFQKEGITIEDNEISFYNKKNLKLYIGLKPEEKKEFQNYELYKYDNLIKYYQNKFDENKIRSFLCKILNSKVIKEAFSFFYGNNIKYPFSSEYSAKNYLDKYLKFIPLKIETTDGVTEKFSMETYIFLNNKFDVHNSLNDIEKNFSINKKLISKALINGAIVEIHFHELNHNFHNYYYCLQNGNETLKTPRKIELDERESGNNMEIILFGRVLNELTLRQALYILNEKNYNKSLYQFREDFLKLKKDYCECEGAFKEYSVLKSEVIESLDYMTIRFKKSDNSIKFNKKDDVLGFPNFNEEA